SSSKTTTLEVFSPATTPGATQGDDLPLTSTTQLPPAGYQRQSSLPEQSKQPQHRPRHHNHHHHQQQPKPALQQQQPPLPYYSWSPQGQQSRESQQSQQQPDLYNMFPDRPGLELGYATVGPRGSRSTPLKFSTLQRPRPSSSSSSSTPVTSSHAILPLDLQGAPSHRHAAHEYANTHYASAHAPDAHYSSTLTRTAHNGHKLVRRPSFDQAPHAHAGQEDSGSSGYGGSPRQEMGPAKGGPQVSSPPVTSPGTGGMPHSSKDTSSTADSSSASTLRRQRSLLDANKKAVADAAQVPIREIINGGGGSKYS
ncbi:bromodomain-containing protein 4A-like, partial [Penaeus japonicus]|uniref:bromodomain-containing protein 4A-like n=1 Tax=Penaeus japonicus TaxID=27405 RepID=UPI001C716667